MNEAKHTGLPVRIWASNSHPPFFDKAETFNSTEFIRADAVQDLVKALEECASAKMPGAARTIARSALAKFKDLSAEKDQ